MTKFEDELHAAALPVSLDRNFSRRIMASVEFHNRVRRTQRLLLWLAALLGAVTVIFLLADHFFQLIWTGVGHWGKARHHLDTFVSVLGQAVPWLLLACAILPLGMVNFVRWFETKHLGRRITSTTKQEEAMVMRNLLAKIKIASVTLGVLVAGGGFASALVYAAPGHQSTLKAAQHKLVQSVQSAQDQPCGHPSPDCPPVQNNQVPPPNCYAPTGFGCGPVQGSGDSQVTGSIAGTLVVPPATTGGGSSKSGGSGGSGGSGNQPPTHCYAPSGTSCGPVQGGGSGTCQEIYPGGCGSGNGGTPCLMDESTSGSDGSGCGPAPAPSGSAQGGDGGTIVGQAGSPTVNKQ